MTPVETATWEKIRELASRFQRADSIVMGVPMWNFSLGESPNLDHAPRNETPN
jgi:FMN-dependent NADH-azoreductase